MEVILDQFNTNLSKDIEEKKILDKSTTEMLKDILSIFLVNDKEYAYDVEGCLSIVAEYCPPKKKTYEKKV